MSEQMAGQTTQSATRAPGLVPTLIVEDDVAVAGIHQGFLLAHGGFEVVGVAHTGVEALELADRLRPALLLLDIHLPDISGIDVLRQLRGRVLDPAQDVIAITAAQEVETVQAAMAGGVVDYLVKPFTIKTLNARLDRYLAHRSRALPTGPLDQRTIDRMRGVGQGSRPPPALRLPKGLAEETLAQVREALAVCGEGSAAEVAAELGMSRVSVRRYLEFLVESGRATRHPRYGSTGRPEIGYRPGPASGR